MIITQTPLRISFLGGGTDYPDYYLRNGGMTLVASINQNTYVNISPLASFFKYKIGLHYSKVEKVNCVDDLEHPAVRECLKYMNVTSGIEIHIASDLPARSGLGSSSSFTIGLLRALHEFKNLKINNFELAKQAVYVEQKMIGERVGSQDQFSCALGGINLIDFGVDGEISLNSICNSKIFELKNNLMIFYTGIQRYAHKILEKQIKSTREGQLDTVLADLKNITKHGFNILTQRKYSIVEFGQCLDEAWKLKRKFSSDVTNNNIDDLYERAIEAGAVGGKLLGAGGGGFLLFFVEPQNQDSVRKAISPLKEVPFDFSFQGSRTIFKQI